MPSLDALLTFAAFSVVIVVIPGPSIAFIIGRGVALGRRAALDTVVGNTAGAVLQVAVVAAGLTPLLERSETTYDVIRLAGAAYLVVLGYRAITSTERLVIDPEAESADRGRHIREGFIVGLTNPKLAIFLAATLPQFIDADGVAGTATQIAALGLVFALVALVCDSVWAIAAGAARDWFGRSEERLRQLRAGGGLVMVGVGVYAALRS